MNLLFCATFLLMTADVQVQAEEDFLRAINVSMQAAPADSHSLNDPAPITPSDLRITGVNMTGANEGYVYVGGTITCTGYSVPPPAPSSYYWTDLGTGQVLQGQSIYFVRATTTRITCRASNVIDRVTYSATTNPLTVTARIGPIAPITASDLRITGVRMTGTNSGEVNVYDIVTCTGYSNPQPTPFSYYWTDLGTGQVLNAQSIYFTRTGTTWITCRASNVIDRVTYSATTNPLTVTIRRFGSAAASMQASVILMVTLILLLRFC